MTRPLRRGSTAGQQVARMLALVPYIARRPGVSIAELAEEFDVDTDQIMADLNQLMLCGEPGYYPNELIDVVLDEEGGTVSIAYDAGLQDPVRLSPEEAITLTMGLRALEGLPGLLDGDAVRSMLAKLEHAAGTAPASVEVAPGEPAPSLATIRRALDAGYRLRISYYSASSDQLSDRDVDPLRVLVVDGWSYLEGYCYTAEKVLRFRADRIEHAQMLDVPIQQPLWVDQSAPDSLFTPSRDVPSYTLRLWPAAGWVAENFVMDEVVAVPGPEGLLQVRMRAPGDEWIVRLVLSLGGAAELIDRPDLDSVVRDRARAALRLHGIGPSAGHRG